MTAKSHTLRLLHREHVIEERVTCVQAAALKLAYMEYADLGLEERLALLQGLLEQALDCEDVRELITSKVESMALPRQKKPVSH